MGRGNFSLPQFDHITFDPNVMGGRACIRNTRVTVSLVLNLVANGMSIEEIVEAYPYLEPEDVRQALRYAPLDGMGDRLVTPASRRFGG